MKFRNFAIAAAALAFSSFPAWADSYSYNFNSGTGDGPTSQTFTVNGVSLTATGYISNELANLYFKNGGGSETGAGLTRLTDHEIMGNGFIQLDLGNVMAAIPTGTVTLAVGSVQPGETFSLYGSNTAGMEGAWLGTGTSADIMFNLSNPLGYRYISIGSSSGNVLLDAVTVSTPEPGAAVLMIAGLMGIAAAAMFFRRGITLGLRDGIA